MILENTMKESPELEKFIKTTQERIVQLEQDREADVDPPITTIGIGQAHATAFETINYLMQYPEYVEKQIFRSPSKRTKQLEAAFRKAGWEEGVIEREDLAEIPFENVNLPYIPSFIDEMVHRMETGEHTAKFNIVLTHGGYIKQMALSVFDEDIPYVYNCSISIVKYDTSIREWIPVIWSFIDHLGARVT
jgi:hypothetical protein